MKLATLRYVDKINRNVLQNSRRNFSFKFEMTPAARPSDAEEEAAPKPDAPFRYNVCQPRTTSVERPSTNNDQQTAKAAIEEQQLQPSMLPQYFQKQMERNVLVHPDPDLSEGDRIHKGLKPARAFQVSKTYANAILPLKSVKLANPFPEPVKMMMSRTVSDDEKAEQMLADARSQRNMDKSNFRSFSSSVRRWYSSKTVSTDADKCKKFPKATKKGSCPKMILPNCPPQARTRCKPVPKQKDCKKQEAPYPAYSEFCHEDLDEKPSECRLCPWKNEDNPNFKPQKKKLHVSASLLGLRRSGLEVELPLENVEDAGEDVHEMHCDLRKPACERPKNRRCPPTKEEKKKEEAKKKKKEKPKSECLEQAFEDKVLPSESSRGFFMTSKDKLPSEQGPCKVKKFKFPKCEQAKKEEEIVEKGGRCPTKKKKRWIKDCPPSGEEKCGEENVLEELRLGAADKNDDAKKCPKVDMTVNRPEEPDEDPCKLRKKGVTKVCPGDLLKKKRKKPGKKASAAIAPPETKMEPPQPTQRV